MREIEFRGKRKDNGQWVYGDLLQGCEICNICEISDKSSIDGSRYEVIPKTIGQYADLKDKNGVKIYEKDIVQIDKDVANIFEIRNIAVIKYIGGMFLATYDENKITQSLFVLRDLNYNLRGKVIGNTIDNPELLELEGE